MAVLLAGVPCAAHATTYTWNTTTGGNWSGTSNWNPPPPTGGPDGTATSTANAADTAVLDDTTANRIVVYDAAASGFLNTLQINQTSAFTNELQLARSLGLTNALTVGSTGGSAVLDLQNNTLTTPTLTIGSGGTLLLGLTAAANSSSQNFIVGNTVVNGGTITTNSAVGTGNGTITETNNGSFTMTSGTINLTQSATGGVRFAVGGGVNITGGTINYTGTNTTNGGINEFYMSGTTSNVLGNAANPVTITTPNSNTGTGATGNGAGVTLNNNGTESLSYNLTAGSAAFDLHNRSTNATGTVTHTLTYTGASAAGPIGTLYLNQTFGAGGSSAAVNTLKLGSNLTTVAASSSTLILARDPQAASTGVLNLDLAGYTLNGTAVTGALALSNVTNGTDSWTLNSSTGTGTIQAASFNFTPGAGGNLRLTVGANVVLQATGTTNNAFGVTTPTSGTSATSFDPTSTFLYTGSAATINTVGTSATPTLGKVTVGDGNSTSVLTLSSNLTAAGAITINRASTLALVANTLTAPTGGVTIAGGGNLNANVLNQALLTQIASASGTTSTPAYLNLTAAQTVAAGNTLDFNTPGLANVSLGGNNTLTVTAGQIIPANSTYQLGSPLGTFGITGAGLSGNNNLVVNGNVRIASSVASYTGSTTINAGTLSATTNSRIPSSTALTVNSSGTFDLVNTDTGTTQTLASLAGAGNVTNTSVTGTGNPAKTLVINGSTATVFSGTITEGGNGGTLALTRAGTGTLTLSGPSYYTGGTNVTGGTLLVNGGNNGTGAVSLSGGTLGGTNTLSGALAMTGGTITGGTAGGVGMLTFAANGALGGGTYQVDISGATSDRLIFSGGSTLTLGGTSLTINGTLDGTTTYVIATYGSETGTFASSNVPANYTLSYGATEIDLIPGAAVPEPSTWLGGALLLAGLGWRGLSRRRRVAL